jgi:hypothetical protein
MATITNLIPEPSSLEGGGFSESSVEWDNRKQKITSALSGLNISSAKMMLREVERSLEIIKAVIKESS